MPLFLSLTLCDFENDFLTSPCTVHYPCYYVEAFSASSSDFPVAVRRTVLFCPVLSCQPQLFTNLPIFFFVLLKLHFSVLFVSGAQNVTALTQMKLPGTPTVLTHPVLTGEELTTELVRMLCLTACPPICLQAKGSAKTAALWVKVRHMEV